MRNSLCLLAAAGAVLSLAGCASRTPAPTSFPDKFTVSSRGFFGDSFSVTSEGDRLVYRRFSSEPFRSQTVRISPSDHQWQAFWSEMKAVSLRAWKPSYKPDFIVDDGTNWSIEIEHDGRRVISEGDNAYPGDHNPAITSTEPGKRYARFLTALRTLIGNREFY